MKIVVKGGNATRVLLVVSDFGDCKIEEDQGDRGSFPEYEYEGPAISATVLNGSKLKIHTQAPFELLSNPGEERAFLDTVVRALGYEARRRRPRRK